MHKVASDGRTAASTNSCPGSGALSRSRSRLIKTCFQTTRTLYLAVVLDLFTRKIVDWAMRDLMRAELTIAALTMAIQRQKPPPGLTHYSDRGSQYAAADYRKVLDAAGMIQSMSRKGNCWDNAAMEGCFGTLKTELVHQACYPTRDAARHDLFAYIEGYYNRQRLHFTLGYITPEQADEIIEQNNFVRDWGGKFVVPIPEIHVYP
jgi:putative transposase